MDRLIEGLTAAALVVLIASPPLWYFLSPYVRPVFPKQTQREAPAELRVLEGSRRRLRTTAFLLYASWTVFALVHDFHHTDPPILFRLWEALFVSALLIGAVPNLRIGAWFARALEGDNARARASVVAPIAVIVAFMVAGAVVKVRVDSFAVDAAAPMFVLGLGVLSDSRLRMLADVFVRGRGAEPPTPLTPRAIESALGTVLIVVSLLAGIAAAGLGIHVDP
ncbi:MAG: hypothetical protein SF028_04440 [Candidatus Sumerlaeia bacterium]|nr:hypothetical protein [Candidatus Sumerlaeia bacterium]